MTPEMTDHKNRPVKLSIGLAKETLPCNMNREPQWNRIITSKVLLNYEVDLEEMSRHRVWVANPVRSEPM